MYIDKSLLEALDYIRRDGRVPLADISFEAWFNKVRLRIRSKDGYYLRISENGGFDKAEKPLYFRDTGDVYSGTLSEIKAWIDRHYE